MDQETLDLIAKYRQYNPEAVNFTDEQIASMGLPGFNNIPKRTDFSGYEMSTFPVNDIFNKLDANAMSLNTTNEPIFSNPGPAELEPTFAGDYGSVQYGDNDGFSLKSLIPFSEGSLSRSILEGIGNFLPKQDPRQVALNKFYATRGGLDSIGRVQSGLMKGYAPVSGGALNFFTGGKFGEPTNYGLQRSYDKRMDTIENTLGKKYGLDADDIASIYAGTFEEDVINPRTGKQTDLIQRLIDLNRLKTDEAAMLSNIVSGDGVGINVDTSTGDGTGSTGSYDTAAIDVPANVIAAGGSYDGFQSNEGGLEYTGSPQNNVGFGAADFGPAEGEFSGLKKGGIVSLL
jgi:Fe-S-cluster formation regulator IscX/YfhJ